MDEITHFVALPFDVANGDFVAGEPVKCASPMAAIERAKGFWKIFWPCRCIGVRSHRLSGNSHDGAQTIWQSAGGFFRPERRCGQRSLA